MSSHIVALARHTERIEELAQLLHQEWAGFAPWADVACIQARLRAAAGDALVPCCLLAMDDAGLLQGTASIKLQELASRPQYQYWLGEVWVDPELRGQGIGTALILACIAHARQARIDALYLYTPDQQALYQRFGWREVDTESVHGESVSVMCLQIQT